MRIATLDLFDETIQGTTTTWYTPGSTYDALALGDVIAATAAVFNVQNSPTLTIQIEHSADGKNWNNLMTSPEVSQAISTLSNTALYFTNAAPTLGLARFRIQLSATGTNSTCQCRLKIAATTRST